MTHGQAKQLIKQRIVDRCNAKGTQYRENTMAEAVLEIFTDLFLAMGEESGKLEDRIRALEAGTQEGN